MRLHTLLALSLLISTGITAWPQEHDPEIEQALVDLAKLGTKFEFNLSRDSRRGTGREVKADFIRDSLNTRRIVRIEVSVLIAGKQLLKFELGPKAGPGSLKPLLKGLESLAKLESDAALSYLKGFRDVRSLNLSGVELTSAALTRLGEFRDLRLLNVSGTNLTDVDIEVVKHLTQLETLNLQGTRISDLGLEHLKGLTKLQTLNVTSTQLTAAGVKELRKVLPKAKILASIK